jgi:hypothetical protein
LLRVALDERELFMGTPNATADAIDEYLAVDPYFGL